ncbi:hypothetical protein BX616_008512, partial [Lobosporangium transversale]
NHAGVVQRLVQKEKEVTQLRETIERMEKKYKDKAELVTVNLWTIVEKFGERVFQMRDIEKDWPSCHDEFLEGIQHIVGKRGIILSFSDPLNGSSSSSSSSSSSTSMSSASLSMASSRRHSFIDFELDNLRRDMEEMREEADKMRKELMEAKQEAEEAKHQLLQLQQLQSRSGPPSSNREGTENEHLVSYGFGKRE